jgi:hypothetical protein
MHKNGNFYVESGSILSKINPDTMLDEDVTIIIDIDEGILFKVGRKSSVTNYFNKKCQKYIDCDMPEMIQSLRLITFDILKPEHFDADEICTIINWFANAIGEKMKWFLELPLPEAKRQIEQLQAIGF